MDASYWLFYYSLLLAGTRGGGKFYSMCVCVCVCVFVRTHARALHQVLILCNPMDCGLQGSSVHGVGCHFLLQGIFLTQGSNLHPLHLLHWHENSFPLCHLGSPLFSVLDAKVEAPSGGEVGTIWSN